MKSVRRWSLFFLFAVCLFISPSFSMAWQNGDNIYVDKNARGDGSGTSWNNAFTTIQGAIGSVGEGTQVSIFVAQGVYFENHLILKEGIKLYGSFEGYESSLAERRDVWTHDHWTVIDAEGKHRVLNMRDKTEVNGFILRNGLRDYTLQSNTTLDDSRGGGVYIECDDDVVVRHNIIEHCAVYWQGGGIFIEGSCNHTSAAPLIEFNVIRSCTGYCGGGIEIAGVPEGAPGGTDAIIRHNVLRNNPDGGTSEQGFGLELWTEYDDQCSPRMGDFYNNIIVGFHNIRNWNIDAADVWVWARNSTDRSFISQRWSLGERLYSGCYKYGNPDKYNIFGSNPMFVDEANGDYHLRAGSPCIGTGRGGVNIGLFPYNGTNPPPVDTQPPEISNVSSGSVSGSATIYWMTNEPADSQVEYGLSTGYGSSTPLDSALVANHSVALSGLSANTTYHYRVKSKDAAGNLAVSGDFTFTTAASSVRARLRLVKNNYAYPGEGWDNAIDGDTRGWDGTVSANANPPYAIFAFAENSIKTVSKVRLMSDTGVGFSSRWVTQFTVQVSTTDTNASSFTTVLNKGSKSGGGWQEYSVPPANAKYIKLILDQPSSGWRQIGEFEAYVNP